MSKVSWVVTLVPLVIALGQTVKAFLSGEPLSDQEIELIKWLVNAFIASGAIGGSIAIAHKFKK